MVVLLGLLALSLVIGSAYLLMDIALDETGPIMLVTIQRVVGALFFVALAIIVKIKVAPRRADVLPMMFFALTNSVAPFLLISWGQTKTDSGTAGVLAATTPILATMLGVLLAVEPLRLRIIPGLLLGLVGIGIILGVDFTDLGLGVLAGNLAVVAAAFNFAVAIVLVRVFFPKHDLLSVAAITAFMMVGMLVPLAVITQGPGDLSMSLGAYLAIIATGLGVGGAGTPLYLWLINRAGVVRASLIFYMAPAIAVLLGWAFRGEEPGAHVFVGLALIILSLAWVNEMLPLRRAAPAPASSPSLGLD